MERWRSGVTSCRFPNSLEHVFPEFIAALLVRADFRWMFTLQKQHVPPNCTPGCLMIAHCALLKGQVTCAFQNFPTFKSSGCFGRWTHELWQKIWTKNFACQAGNSTFKQMSPCVSNAIPAASLRQQETNKQTTATSIQTQGASVPA